MRDARGNGVSGDEVGTVAGLGVCAELGASDRVEVDAGSDLTGSLGGTEESGVEFVGRDRDLEDGLRCGAPRQPYRDWCLKRPCLFRTTLPQWQTTSSEPGKSCAENRSSGCCLLICSNRSARFLLHLAQ